MFDDDDDDNNNHRLNLNSSYLTHMHELAEDSDDSEDFLYTGVDAAATTITSSYEDKMRDVLGPDDSDNEDDGNNDHGHEEKMLKSAESHHIVRASILGPPPIKLRLTG